MSEKEQIIDNALLIYTDEYIEMINNEINQFKKYNLERINNITNIMCSCNKCIKNAVYINKTDNKYLCWYHAFVLHKTNSL